MKAVLLATDYLKEMDGSFKILETNTSISVATKFSDNYIDSERFKQFILDNGINEVYFILHTGGMNIDSIDLNYSEGDVSKNFMYSIVKSSENDIEYTFKASPNSVTPFYVEDTSDRLIIRLSYDQNALIDENYSKDNFNFLKTISDSDPTMICPTYFNDGEGLVVDTLRATIRDNGVYPNYIIKKRYPTVDYGVYPKVLKVDSIESLEILKNSLSADELLQEYILNLNDLEGGKLKTYRPVQMVYGPNLEVYDFMDPYIHTNKLPLDTTVDYSENGEIEWWEKPKFIQKVHNASLTNRFHTYSFTNVLLNDNTSKSVNDIEVGDIIKSSNLYKLNVDNEHLWKYYVEPSLDVFSGSTMSTTQLVDKEYGNELSLTVKLLTDNGLEFTYGTDGIVLTEDLDNNVRFVEINALSVGDKIIINSIGTDQFQTNTITSLIYSYQQVVRYAFDVEEIDLYLKTDDSQTPQFYMINHNPPGECSCYTGSKVSCSSPCLSSGECEEAFGGKCCFETPAGISITDQGPGPCGPAK